MKTKTGLIDRGFSQKIGDKYTHLKLFTINFAPILSTKRIIPRMRWLELIYAMPYVVLRREIVNSFAKTKNVLTSVKQTWNIFVHLEFPLSRYIYLRSGSERTPPAGIEKESTVTIDQMPLVQKIISSSKELAQPLAVTNYQVPVVTEQPPIVIFKPYDISDKHREFYSLSSIGNFIAPFFSYYSRKPALFLSQMTALGKRKILRLNLQKGDGAPRHMHLQREQLHDGLSSAIEFAQLPSHEIAAVETEQKSAVTNYQLPLAPFKLPTVNLTPAMVSTQYLERSILSRAKEFVNIIPYFNFANHNQTLSHTLGGEKAPLYHTYPKIEHVTSIHTEIIKERVIEKEVETKPPHATPQLPSIDVNRLTDQIYQLMERKVRIERERRGL